jgi:hypothetical protein
VGSRRHRKAEKRVQETEEPQLPKIPVARYFGWAAALYKLSNASLASVNGLLKPFIQSIPNQCIQGEQLTRCTATPLPPPAIQQK